MTLTMAPAAYRKAIKAAFFAGFTASVPRQSMAEAWENAECRKAIDEQVDRLLAPKPLSGAT